MKETRILGHSVGCPWDQSSVSSFELKGVPAKGWNCGTQYGRQGKTCCDCAGYINTRLGKEPRWEKGGIKAIWEETGMENKWMRE